MNYKILLFLSLMLITSTIVSATENTTSDNTIISDNTDNQDNTNIIREDNKNIKKTPATSIELDDAYAETYYGGRITYNAKSDNENQVNEGKISLYVNNTHITTENVAESIDWIYNEEYNEVLDTLIPGDYPMKIIYQNDDTQIESNNATLYISKANSYLYQNGEITNDNTDITLPLSIITESNAIAINHGSITAYYNNTEITSIDVKDDEVTTLTIASNYQQKTIKVTYTDNTNMLKESTLDVFLDVIINNNATRDTNITLTDAHIINQTHTQDNQTIYDDIAIHINLNVCESNENKSIEEGLIQAYYNNTLIATSNNTTSIIIPAKYNLEEINITYTGSGIYKEASNLFSIMADKITTRTYSSYITTTKNTPVNIYPRITSNIAFTYGKINLYIDNNLIKTINMDDDIYISINKSYTTIGANMDLNGYEEGKYQLTIEVEENNIFTTSDYTTTLTINKINTYIYAYNQTTYIGENNNIYAYVYANNKKTINTGQMRFTIDNELISTEYVKNNTASIKYTPASKLTLGKHTLQITYESDDTYNQSTKEVTITITKTATTTTLKTWTVEDEKIILNVTTRAWNKTINKGNITTYINNNKVATSNITNNTAKITLPDNITTDKYYHLKIIYEETDLLTGSTYENTNFIFNKKNTTTRTYAYLRNNGTLTLTGYVYSDNYAKVNAGEIIFTINKQIIAKAEVKNNKANTTYDMSQYEAGNYTIQSTYNASKLYNISNNTTQVTKNPYYHTTYMNILNRSLTIKRGSSTPINATLTCYSRNITEDINATITLNATWATVVYSQDATFYNGTLNTILSLPNDFELFTWEGNEISKYTLIISTKQSKNFKETSQTATIYIGEYSTLYQKNLWGYKKANITFNSTLQDKNKNTAKTNTTATIDIYTQDTKTKIQTINTTITNGILDYNYNIASNMTDNTYLVNITVHSNNDYSGCYKTVNMTLNNRRTYISTTNIKGYIQKTLIINGSIMDSITKNKADTNAQIDILIDNNKVATINASKGNFKHILNNNYTKGIHNMTINYHADNIYSNSTRNVNFTSNKNTIRITAPTITAKIGDTINIKANITNTSGNLIKDQLKANIQVNNKTIASNITITNGQLNYNYTITSDTTSNSKITINIEETSKYEARYATTTLKISKEYQFISMEKTTITTSKGSKIVISGNITDKKGNLISDASLNLKIDGVDIVNITSDDGRFNQEYRVTQNTGTYDVVIMALESNKYLYNAKHMTLKVSG